MGVSLYFLLSLPRNLLMTPYQSRLTPLTQRMAEDMLVRNLASSAIDAGWSTSAGGQVFARSPLEEIWTSPTLENRTPDPPARSTYAST